LADRFRDAPARLGVGLVYFPALYPIFAAADSAPAVLELEPQTLWQQTQVDGRWRYTVPDDYLAAVSELGQSKLVHGVGQPIGGSTPDPIEHLGLLRQTVDALDPEWVSEHLSYMRISTRGRVCESGFLLPPVQSDEAVRVAAANIDRFRSELARPIVFETGVNYLHGCYGGLDDGTFVRRVSEAADSGILLDLHNLWCNHVNGRAEITDVLSRIPLERVWEVHLAGGASLDGYRLDAHSDVVDDDLLAIAADTVPRLGNLRAIIYEVMPNEADRLGLDTVHEQVCSLRELWDLVPPSRVNVSTASDRSVQPASESDLLAVADWERSLHELVRSADGSEALAAAGLKNDPGIAVYRRLIADARLGSIARVVRFTVSLLLIQLGRRAANELLTRYLASTDAQSYAGVEGLQFCDFLRRTVDADPANGLGAIPHLHEVLSYERAVLRAEICGESTTVSWQTDPAPIFAALAGGRPPPPLPLVPQSMTVTAHAQT
jgi:uncharacterized protein